MPGLLKSAVRPALFSLTIAVVSLALMVLPAVFGGEYIPNDTLVVVAVAALGFGIIAYLVVAAVRRFAAKVGLGTSIAGAVGFAAIVGTALAYILPSCPGDTSGTRCALPAAAGWGFSSAMLIVVFGSIYFILTRGFQGTMSVVRRLRNAYKKQEAVLAEQTKEEERAQEREVLEKARKEAKNRDPQAVKGYATPKQLKPHQRKKQIK